MQPHYPDARPLKLFASVRRKFGPKFFQGLEKWPHLSRGVICDISEYP